MQPNLVFLMSDQQSRDGLGCYANPEGNQVNFVMESQRLARDFFEAQAEGQT